MVQGVPRFNVEQKVEMQPISYVKDNLDQLVRDNHHFSLYLFPFMDECQVNTWNRKEKDRTFVGRLLESIELTKGSLIEFVKISIDAWQPHGLGISLLTQEAYRSRPSLTAASDEDRIFCWRAIKASIARSITCIKSWSSRSPSRIRSRYANASSTSIKTSMKNYTVKSRTPGLPYTLLEVRFTPEHDRTLIGAGRGRRSTWIDLVCNDSQGFEKYYVKAEELMKEIEARPHLGKFCESFNKADMVRVHGDNFRRFLELVDEHDPDGKFTSGFTGSLATHRS